MVEGEIALMRLLTRIKEFPFVSSAAALETRWRQEEGLMERQSGMEADDPPWGGRK